MDPSSVDHLSFEIIELILSRCPLESVVRFKSVSKSWQSIISDPRFSRLHRIQRSKLPEDPNKFFLLRFGDPRYSLHLIRLEDERFRTKSESLLGYPSFSFNPLCYCDGLFLLGTYHDEYMLWNPLIRKHIIIPAFNPKTHPNAFANWIDPYYPLRPLICHLYHDSITDDYKIVVVFLCGLQCYTVYSCKNGSWGEIKDFPRDWDLGQRTCRAGVDGCLYGMLYDGDTEMICFDARDGKLHKFRQPEGTECVVQLRLEVVSGRLCLYGYKYYQRLQLWVMEKKHGSFEKIWRKFISMDKEEPFIWNMRPIYLTGKDDVVLSATVPKTENGKYKHFIYNSSGNCSFKEIDFIWDDDFDQCFPYSENLDMPYSNTPSVGTSIKEKTFEG